MWLRLLTTFCHVASQMSYRWQPGPVRDFSSPKPASVDEYTGDLTTIPESVWRECMRQLLAEKKAIDLRFIRYLRDNDPHGEALLAATLKHLSLVRAAGGQFVTIMDHEYPVLLRSLQDPPLCLTLRGRTELLQRPMVSVIGSRKGSGLGVQQSFQLGRELAERELVTVSGGAFGCDVAAHHGVLAAGRSPALAIVVFAGGLSKLYPTGNAKLFLEIEKSGGLFMSERLWWAPARPYDFPVRNRLISGLSGVTFVAQAGKPSGAYITARMALDQGRDVAVLVHPRHDVRAAGSWALIEDGAQSYEDVCAFIAAIEKSAVDLRHPVAHVDPLLPRTFRS